MNKKILIIPISIVLALALLTQIPQMHFSILEVYANGVPDTYGNRILSLWVMQWSGSAFVWTYQANNSYTTNGLSTFDGLTIAPSGGNVNTFINGSMYWKVNPNNQTEFYAWVALNNTFAPDVVTGESYFTLYMNLTSSSYSLTNAQFSLGSYTTTANYFEYNMTYNWNIGGQPTAGVSYNIGVWYNVFS